MKTGRISTILSLLAGTLISISIITSGTGCASIVPPTGGPKDSLPPVILNVTPKDSTLNFNSKKILFNFNEFIQLNEVQKNLLVNPTPKINPILDVKLKTITVTIKDTLEENTTYALDFGNAIRDLNEGNVLRDYTYIFSTGQKLDSLKLAGKVIVAETGKTDSTLFVMLHKSLDDSAVVKDRPRYVTRVDSGGNFQFNNLAPGTFAIYALKDEGGSRRYLSKDQLFAFADSPVTSQSQKRDIILYAFTEKDTTKETTGVSKQPPAKKKGIPGADRVLKMQTNLVSGGELDLLSNLELNFFPDPLRYFDSTKVLFTDEAFKPLTNYYFKKDTSNKKITLVYPWTENTRYNLVLDTAFAEDTMGRKLLKKDTISFQTKRNSDYGLVRLRFLKLPLKDHPVLQFVQGEEVKYSHVFTNNEFYAKLFLPGEYELRIVFDTNKNGVWDTGEFFKKHLQPEKVQRITRKIMVKPNWDNEIDIQL
jgi:hypothetical protein